MASFQSIYRSLAIALVSFTGCALFGQNSYESFHSPNYLTIDRAIILNGRPNDMHTSLFPYRRGDIADIAGYMLTQSKSKKQEQRLLWTLMDNNEFLTSGVRDYWEDESPLDSVVYDLSTREFSFYDSTGVLKYANTLASNKVFLKHFYKTPSFLYELDTKAFYLRVNPMINFGYGKEDNVSGPLFYNQRGVEVRGGIDGRIFFGANIVESQVKAASHFRWWQDRYESFPDAGKFKQYNSDFFNVEDGVDYLMAEGYVGFNITRHVGVHFGHGKNFIGDGYRSLFISDFARNYLYLKFNTRVWKFHYQNIFAELAETTENDPNSLIPKKYMAAHYLSFQATPTLSFGIFETVMFDRSNGQFEFQYLNPVILYRTIEASLGSPDNVLLGFNARWDFLRRFSLYGQLHFDEFRFNEMFGGNQWWGNKWAAQIGLKYIDVFGVDQLDLQVEYNQVRPFTYTHRDSSASFSHFNQPLAHPMGANFRELILIGRYRPWARLDLEGKLFFVGTAEDTDSVFYGQDILRSNEERNADFGVEQGQGIGVNTFVANLSARYMLKQNLFVEARYFYRRYDAELDASDLTTQYVSLGIRWNLYRERDEF